MRDRRGEHVGSGRLRKNGKEGIKGTRFQRFLRRKRRKGSQFRYLNGYYIH